MLVINGFECEQAAMPLEATISANRVKKKTPNSPFYGNALECRE
jgi:hypothetical protein